MGDVYDLGSRGQDEPGYPVSAQVIDELREIANSIAASAESAQNNGDDVARASGQFDATLAALLLREVHLSIRRAHEAMADGIPPDSAHFLAIDDMGFQVALSVARAWRAM